MDEQRIAWAAIRIVDVPLTFFLWLSRTCEEWADQAEWRTERRLARKEARRG